MRKGVAVALGAVGVWSVSFATPAHADEFDFVDFLDENGVYYESMSDVIDIGKLTCRALRNDQPVQVVFRNLQSSFDFAPVEAAAVLAGATMNMCSDEQARVEAWVDSFSTETSRS